jgi:DNA polymerase-3 subunit delta
MPKFEPKTIQKELEKGQIWPVYWIYGGERMKVRELVKRIRRAVVDDESSAIGLAEESIDAAESSAAAILDSAQSLSLGGGARFIVVRDAHALKEAEMLSPLLGPPVAKKELSSVCVFISKDLDARKKFSKALVEKAAVVSCEEVLEAEREAWVAYLAKRKEVTLTPEVQMRLASLDPWSLDIVDQELEKFSLDAMNSDTLLEATGATADTDRFLQAFFTRKLGEAMLGVEGFAERPDESLPLLGLLGWNVKQLATLIADREGKTRFAKVPQFVAPRLQSWAAHWSLNEITALQAELADLDFALKQTPLLPLGAWDELVIRFCHEARQLGS